MEFDWQGLWVFTYDWVLDHGLAIVLIVAGAFVAQIVARHFIAKVIRKLVPSGRISKEAEEKREETLIRALGGTANVLIWVVTLLTVLSEVGVAIGPLLAAAGIVGVAVGFGGQYLIRDVITGLFVLLENQYRVGDIVCLGETCGVVEHITLRVTTLRDLDGTAYHVPHGEIQKVANLSKGFARVHLDIGIAYSSDLAKVIEVVNEVGKEMAEDDEWKDKILTPPEFLRVNEFADSAIMIKILGDTKPASQWEVAGEYRKRLKIAFDREGIEIPFPQRVLHNAK